MTTRRQCVLGAVPAAILALTSGRIAAAQAARLEESAPTAVALGYKHDASKVDAKRYPAFVAGRNCSGCQFFQGKAGEAWGACSAVGGKLVNVKGWCAAWVKKA
jgi:High potential iron-sulfur protein